MKKYIRAARNTWEEAFSYRFNFLIWRVRNVILLISMYFLWLAVLPEGTDLFGYDQSSMLTYILLTSIVGAVVTSNRSYAIGQEINDGNLSNFLLQPINYFAYWFSRDIGDKLMNLIFSIVEIALIFIIIKPPFYFQTSLDFILFFIVSIILAIILYFFINILLGMIGFWSPDVWAPRFIFWILVGFFAGQYFPLDILPPTIYEIFKLLPFSYLIYFPIKVYLGQLSYNEIFYGFLITFVWIIIFAFIVNIVWKKGLKSYTAVGK